MNPPRAPDGSRQAAAATAPVLHVVVSIAPLAGLVTPLARAVAPESRVITLVPPGVSEHGYEPTPAQLSDLNRADLIVLVGLGLEPGVERAVAARPRLAERTLVLGTHNDIARSGPASVHSTGHGDSHEDHDKHSDRTDHADSEDCDHGSAGDPHFWLDPRAVRALVPALRDALAARLRAGTAPLLAEQSGPALARLDAAATKLEADLDKLDGEFAEALAPFANASVVVGHDAYGWLARRYSLKIVALAGLNAGEPTPAALAAAARAIRERGLASVYVEPQLSRAAGERIAALTGATVRQLDPLGTGDYFTLMRANLDALLAGFRAQRPTPVSEPKMR